MSSIDALLTEHAKGWTLARMPALDRAALRMGTAELITRADVPTAVVLNETVELASRFSTDDSGRFVNGLLAKIATEVRGPGDRAAGPAAAVRRSACLRPWQVADAPALVAAWADPEIQRWTGVPDRRDLAAAERWIAGDEERRRRDLSLDLVVERDGEVAGEVGLSSIDRVAAPPRSAGGRPPPIDDRASPRPRPRCWSAGPTTELGLACVARCDPANPGSVAVAERAGAMVLL